MAEKINVGKFINNIDKEDLSSEKLQGVVNNVYAKAIKDHKQTTKIADDNLKDLEKETVEFVKSNHDRLKANKETPDKELNENYSVVDLSSGERFGNYDSVESARVKALQYYRLGLAEGRLAIVDDNLNPIGWVSPQGKLNKSIEENKHSTTKIVESFERALKPGDKIVVRGTEVTIGNIIDQYYDKDYIDIEFEDDKGNYRSWKSDIDGGKVIYKESKQLGEDVDEFEVAKYKGNQYGIWSKSSKNWMTFGKKKDLEKQVKELNAKKSKKLKEGITPDSIYDALVKELPAEDIDHHRSDLYVRKTPKSTEIINKLDNKSLLSTFVDNIDKEVWYELPFCYTPFWNSKSKQVNEASHKNIVETSIPRNASKIKVGGREFTKNDKYWSYDDKDSLTGKVNVSPNDIKRLYGNDVEVLETNPNYKPKRTKEVKVLQGNYGYGWGDLVEYDKEDSAELKQDLRSYRENERNAQFRVVTRRVPLGEDKLTESHNLKRNITNIKFAVKELQKKGYSHEEANDLVLKIFDEHEGDTNKSLEWYLDKVLSKADYNKEYGITEGKEKKIDLYVNGEYVCSSTRYKKVKDFVDAVKKDGKVTYAGLDNNGKLSDNVTKTIKDTDKVVGRIVTESKKLEEGRSSKKLIYTIGDRFVAHQLDGVTSPFNREFDAAKKYRDISNDPNFKHGSIGCKGKSYKTGVNQWVKDVEPTEFMVWTKKENPSWKDDALDVYYRKETVNESKKINEDRIIKNNRFDETTTFEQWFDATFGDSEKYRKSKYYPFKKYIKSFPSAESLKNATAADIVKNAHIFYDVYDVDSADREYAFNFASDVTGRDYDDFYNAWISGTPLNESKKLKEAFNSSDIADWLEDHKQAAEDCKTFFKIDDLSKVRKDRLISWISDHDTLAQDFEIKFNVKLDGETSLEEDWTVFEFTSGSNPYIAKTDKEVKRLLKKYKGRVEWDEYNGNYIVDDKERFGWDKPMVDDDPLPFGPGAPLKENRHIEYIEKELADKSGHPQLQDAYEENELTIIKDGNVWYCEHCPNRLYRLVQKEMKKHFPELRWLYEKTESLKEAINPKFQAFYDKVNSDKQLAKQVDYLYSKVLKTLHYNMDEIRKEVKNRALEDKVAEILEHASLISDQPNSKVAKELNALLDESLNESVKERYKDTRKQAAYENACDCIMYGYGKSYWNSLDLNDEEKKEVWHQAFEDIAESESLKEEKGAVGEKPYIVAYLGKEIASFDYPDEAQKFYWNKTFQDHTVEGYWWGLRDEMPSDLGWKPLKEAKYNDSVSKGQHIASVDLYSTGVSEEDKKKAEKFGHYEIDLDNKVFTRVKERKWLGHYFIDSYPRDTWKEVEQTAKNIMKNGNFKEVSNDEYIKIQKEWESKNK